ncbi:MAG TPA: zinc ribbon domain-containing protein [Pyrinomonadaceae bacterium]|nr:zinc ribbon domain-containing protein [Pyrinomonadaceae bacterium]
MFCPDCGIEDKQSNQFCRACGTDLRPVRTAMLEPDSITASAASAREEIGRAVAVKIREAKSPAELAVVAEDVLPEIEKFLESPAEKRLRRMRTGVIVSSVGMGTAVGISLVSLLMQEPDVIFLAALGVVTFFLGLGFILNGVLLTVPKKGLPDRSPDADSQRQLDAANRQTTGLIHPQTSSPFSSVTENTTRHLKEKDPILSGRD